MADRQVKVTLTAQVAQYIDGMQKAAAATMATGTAAEKLALQRQSFEVLGRSVFAFGAVAAAGTLIAINRFADFDQAMSNVQAATQETAENMALLRDAALEAGASTVFTASEAANAIEELGKNGLSTSQILEGGLSGALSLAAAGQIEVARAAEIAAIAVKQFGLTGADIPRVADLLAAGAGKAAGDVEDLAQALAQSGLVADQTGLSIEETTGILAAFADAGLIGSDAGTSLKTALQRLTPTSAEAQKAMDTLGISAYNSAGSFIGAAQFAGVLQQALKDKSAEERNSALSTIFGSDAVRAATVLYEQGAEGIQGYIDKTNEAGYAAKVAADRLDNLAGDLERLGGSFDSALIKTGAGANDVLRSFVQSATHVVDVVGELPEPVLGAGLAVGAIAAAVGIAGGAALIAVPKIAEFRVAMATMGISAGSAAGRVALFGGAVGLASVVISSFIAANAAAAARTDQFRDSLDKTTGAVTATTRELAKKILLEERAFDSAAKAGISQKELTDAVLEGGEALARIKDRLAEATSGGEGFKNLWDGASFAIVQTQGDLDRINAELEQSKKDWENLTEATDDGTDSTQNAGNAAETARQQIADLALEISNMGSEQLSLREASRKVEQAIDDFSEAVTENGATFDITTQAGRDNEAALDDLAQAYLNKAGAVYAATGSEADAIPVLEEGRAMFLAQAEAAGKSADEAVRLADKLGLIPANVSSVVNVETAEADRRIQNTINLLLGIPNVTVGVGTVLKPSIGNETGGMYSNGVRAFAAGGFPSGVYTGGQNIHKFAETGLPWETYISPKPGYERENIGYALESLSRLGFQGFGGGGGGNITVPVNVQAGLISSPAQVGREVARAVTEAVKVGELSQNWAAPSATYTADELRRYKNALK